jgi:hypothetical protein
MKSSKSTVRLPQQARISLCLVVAVLIGTTSEAYAYIDPGYGSLLWQLAVAGFVGVAFYYRHLIATLRTWFKTIFKDENKNG